MRDVFLPVGTRIASYRIIRVLGAGGLGITYEAVHDRLDRQVVIKEFFPRAIAGREGVVVVVTKPGDRDLFEWMLRRFTEPATRLAQLSHPGIVTIYDVVPANGTGYVLLERLDGETLAERLERSPSNTLASYAEFRTLMEPILDALGHLHSSGLLHYDLSPNNVLIERNGRPVLFEFGSPVAMRQPSTSSSLILAGDQRYAPPEVLADQRQSLGPPSDLFSLAACMYQCVTGERPRPAIERMLKEGLRQPPISEMSKFICPPHVYSAIDQALAVRIEDRPQTADAFIRLLGWDETRIVPSALPYGGPIGAGSGAPRIPHGTIPSREPVDFVWPHYPEPSHLPNAPGIDSGDPVPAFSIRPRRSRPTKPLSIKSLLAFRQRSIPERGSMTADRWRERPDPVLREPPEYGRPSGGLIGAESGGPPMSQGPFSPRRPFDLGSQQTYSQLPAPAPAPQDSYTSEYSGSYTERAKRRWLAPTLLIAGAVALTGIGYFFGRRLLDLALALFKGAIIVPPPAMGRGSDVLDTVDCTVFAPEVVEQGGSVMIQAFLHVPEALPKVESLAQRIDPLTTLGGFTPLDGKIARNAVVSFHLEVDRCQIDKPCQSKLWDGRPIAVNFLLTVPKEVPIPALFPVLHVTVAGRPIGYIRFKIAVIGAAVATESRPTGSGERYKYAFLSYAKENMADVLHCAKALQAAEIEFFQDKLDLKPGDEWQRRLCEGIKRADLFLVFWSSAAKQSEWVRLETEYALEVRRWSPTGLPHIKPIILEGPPPPLPPEELKSIHFDDRLQYMVAALKRDR